MSEQRIDPPASRGYQTAETDNAEEGLRLARASRPALILMDSSFPA